MPRPARIEQTPPPEKVRGPIAVAVRPGLVLAAALIAGIAAHRVAPHWPWVYLVAAAGLLAVALRWRARPFTAGVALLLGVAFCGMSVGQLHAFYYAADEIGRYAGPERRLVQIELILNNEPRVLVAPPGGIPVPPKQVTIARAVSVLTNSGWKDCGGELLVQIAEPHPRLALGQRVRIVGMLERPAPAMNPGHFDWAAYYRDQRILTSLQVPHAAGITILSEGSPGPIDKLRSETRRLLADGFENRYSLDHALLRALVLGDTDPELRPIQDQFKATGTSHHLAISGMHVAVMGGVIFLLCRLIRLGPRAAWGAALAVVLVYGTAALPSAPVVRSVLLWVIVGTGVLLRRPIDLLQLLGVTLLAMLIYRPLDLYNAGFQLSFGTVFGLILLTEHTARRIGWKGTPDPNAAPARNAAEKAGRLGAWLDSRIILTASAGLVAYFISMPLIALHFSQLNPWAILASIALAPLVLAALVGGAAKILFTLCWPSGAGWWAAGARVPVVAMRKTVGWLATWPGGDVPLPAPAVGWVVLYFVCVGFAVTRWRLASVRWTSRSAVAAVLGVILFMPYVVGAGKPVGKETTLTLLCVGAGQCAVIEPPSGRVAVIDAGSASLSDPVRKCIAPFLRSRAITQIDTIAISHANTDHYNAVADLVEHYGVHEVLADAPFLNSIRSTPMGTEMIDDLDRAQRPPRSVAAGQVLPFGTGTDLEVLWPPEKLVGEWSDNDTSMVLRFTHAGTRVLFTGDIEDGAMAALLEHPEALRADVLIAPHHGSSESLTERFVAAVRPQVILSSNDRSLSGKQKRFETLIGKTPLYRTHDAGAVTLKLREDGTFAVQPFLGAAVEFKNEAR